jgi:hypothetical protein
MITSEAIDRLKARGKSIEHALKVQMAGLGIQERALSRKTMYSDTNVWVDFAEGFNISDDSPKLKTILRKVTIGTPVHSIFYERGDAPKSRKGNPIKHTQRDRHPLFGAIVPIQVELLKRELAEFYGLQIADKIKITIPGIYSTQHPTTKIE